MAKLPMNNIIERDWDVDDLRDVWDFAQHDFERFLAMLIWFEKTFG